MEWQQRPENSTARRIMRGARHLGVYVAASLVMGGVVSGVKHGVYNYALESTVEDIEHRNDLPEVVAKELEDIHRPVVEGISKHFDGKAIDEDPKQGILDRLAVERHSQKLSKESPSGNVYEIWMTHRGDAGNNKQTDIADEDVYTYMIMSTSPEGNVEYALISTPRANRDILTDKPTNEWSSEAATKEWVAGNAISARVDTLEIDDTSEKAAQATMNMELAKELLETFENLPDNSLVSDLK
jgi:hypothetical protein